MSNVTKNNSQTIIKRIVTAGMLTALFFVLSRFTIPMGNLRISLNSLPIILCAVLYGPVDALIVGLLGEFLTQLVEYGLSPTLPLWILPQGLRGLVIGIAVVLFLKRQKYIERNLPGFLAVCITAALVTTLTNTAAIAIDALIYGYYSKEYVFSDFSIRIFTGVLTAVLMGLVSVPVLKVLRKCDFGRTY